MNQKLTNAKGNFEDLSQDFIRENLYLFKVEVLGGPIGSATIPVLEMELFFDDGEYGEEIGFSVNWFGGYSSFDPIHTCIIKNGKRYESHSVLNRFLYEMVSKIKKMVCFEDCSKVLSPVYDIKYEICENNGLPTKFVYDYREKFDIEYLYFVSIGVHTALENSKLYKMQVWPEKLYDFLSCLFGGIDIDNDSGVFYDVFIKNNIMDLKDYDDIFLKFVKKRDLELELNYPEDIIRSVYNSNGEGIRCPDCNSFIKYSLVENKYKCCSCERIYTKNYLSELNDAEIVYEKIPPIFKSHNDN